MSRGIIFAEDCMRGNHSLDDQTVKQWVANIVNRSTDYINRIGEGGIGEIVDEEHGLFIKFYVTEKAVLIDEVREDFCVV